MGILSHIEESHTPSSRDYGDRFITNRAVMDFDIAHYLLTEQRRQQDKEDLDPHQSKAKRGAYKELVAMVQMMDRTRILSFKNKLESLW